MNNFYLTMEYEWPMVNAWKEIALPITLLPLWEKFTTIPVLLSLEKDLTESLGLDWDNLVSIFCLIIVVRSRGRELEHAIYFNWLIFYPRQPMIPSNFSVLWLLLIIWWRTIWKPLELKNWNDDKEKYSTEHNFTQTHVGYI